MEEQRPIFGRWLERQDGIAGPPPASPAHGVPHPGIPAVTVELKA
jgi:hypothetical protein